MIYVSGDSYECVVPVIDGRALVNAVGSDANEASVNLSAIDLEDEDIKDVVFCTATLTLHDGQAG